MRNLKSLHALKLSPTVFAHTIARNRTPWVSRLGTNMLTGGLSMRTAFFGFELKLGKYSCYPIYKYKIIKLLLESVKIKRYNKYHRNFLLVRQRLGEVKLA